MVKKVGGRHHGNTKDYSAKIDITSDKMPNILKAQLKNVSPFCRRYAEFRAKGLSQPEAAKKAGSKATTRDSLARVGYNTEQNPGIKDYILWLENKRAKACVIDQQEIVQKFRDVYDEAMASGKYGDANKAAENLAILGGFIDKNKKAISQPSEEIKGIENKNNTEAFTQDTDQEGTELGKRVANLQRMLSDISKG